MGGPKTYVHQLIYDKSDSDDTKMIKYLFMKGLGLCIKVDSFVHGHSLIIQQFQI